MEEIGPIDRCVCKYMYHHRHTHNGKAITEREPRHNCERPYNYFSWELSATTRLTLASGHPHHLKPISTAHQIHHHPILIFQTTELKLRRERKEAKAARQAKRKKKRII
jgi:hypothetical protein